MNKPLFVLIIILIAVAIFFFAPNANSDAAQQTLPGNSPPAGVQQQPHEIHPNITHRNMHYNAGQIGPNTVPNNVNTNGTVNTTPKIFDNHAGENN